MTTPDHDTNPSTPSSKRASDPRISVPAPPARDVDPGKPARSRPTTDPGVAPQSEPLPVPGQPMGIVVPAAGSHANDSVDILLEGISHEQPERPKTTPQTEGQPAAAYHVEHAVRAPQTPPSEEPTVVIDGPTLGRRVRLGRSAVSGPDIDAKWTDTTQVKALPSTSRVVIAVVAGLVVVLVIFVALQRTSPGGPAVPTGAPATVRTAAVAAAPPEATAFDSNRAAAAAPRDAPAPVAPPAVPLESPPAAPPVSAPTGGSRKAAPAARPTKPRPRPAASAAKPPAGDLGEFKGSF